MREPCSSPWCGNIATDIITVGEPPRIAYYVCTDCAMDMVSRLRQRHEPFVREACA